MTTPQHDVQTAELDFILHQEAAMETILVARILSQLEPCTGIAANDAPVQVHIYPLYMHRA